VDHVEDIPVNWGGWWRLSFGTYEWQFFAIDYEGRVFSSPGDGESPWTERINLNNLGYCCGFSRLVQTPGSGSFYTISDYYTVEVDASFSGAATRPSLPYYSWETWNLMANTVTTDLVNISRDGLVYARPPDAATAWTQRAALPYSGRWDDYWVGLTQGPTDDAMFAITRRGDLYEIASDFSMATARPDLPATNVQDLIAISYPTALLIALTDDGRVFTRPDDTSTPWTLRLTLPRNVYP
jgi:hypothetical protein